MTASEELRAAAKRMRAVVGEATPGPWWIEFDGNSRTIEPDIHDDEGGAVLPTNADAKHIAAWHPAVALAVADLLDRAAKLQEFADRDDYMLPLGDAVLVVARRFLGVEATS